MTSTNQQEDPTLASRIASATSIKDTAGPFVKGGLYEDAIKIYESAYYTLKPSGGDRTNFYSKKGQDLEHELLNQLSYCYSQLNRNEEAINYAKRVLIDDPENLEALRQLAECYRNQHDYAAAYHEIEKYQRAFKHQKSNRPLDPKTIELTKFLKEKLKPILDERERRERELLDMVANNPYSNKTQEVAKRDRNEEPRKSIFSYRIVRFGIGLGLTGLIGYILYRNAKRRAEEAARNMLPALILAVGAICCLRYVKGHVRSSLFGLGMGIAATIMVQRANKKYGW